MKTYVTCILLFISLSLKAQTWVYHSFPHVNSYWNLYQSFYCWSGVPGPVFQAYAIRVATDTIIGSETYHKLYIPLLSIDSTGCSTASTSYGIYKGCIREDNFAKKVYYIKPSVSTEKLLYDFNLQVGDTIFGELEASPKDTVISMDSVQISSSGGSWVKRWFINSCYNIYIIEGVGSTYGLLEASPGCAPDNMERDISCMVAFTPSSSYIYPNITDCDILNSLGSSKKEMEIQIFPNPSNGLFQIDFKDNLFQELIISNLLGDVVLKEKVRSLNKVLVTDLDIGIYILTLVDKANRKINKKIIITR